MSGAGEKTEKPTAKRLKDLRKKGTAARSNELPTVLSLLALSVAIPAGMRNLWTSLSTSMAVDLQGAGTADQRTAVRLLADAGTSAAKSVLPMVIVVGVCAILASVAVTRQKPNPMALKPKADRLSPKQGVKRLFGIQSLVELLRVVVKLGLVTLVGWSAIGAAYAGLKSSGQPVDQLTAFIGHSAAGMLMRAAALALLIGVADAWWALKRYQKQAKMTKQEVREEHKSTEGNPHVKGAIRAKQRAMSRSRMITAVQKADVVLANPTHIAVALRYEGGSSAPIVVAKGAGAIAQRIKAEAANHGVPVIENRPLARTLWRACEIGDVIPVDLYQAVAQVLATVYAARRGTAARRTA